MDLVDEIVQHAHAPSVSQKGSGNMATDEAGAAGDEDCFGHDNETRGEAGRIRIMRG